MTPGPPWLEILKASGWQTGAVAVACGLFLLAGSRGWLPPLEPWLVKAAALVMLLSGSLALAASISTTLKFFPLQIWFIHWCTRRKETYLLLSYIPHMTPTEKKILGHLLAKNQKTFTAPIDGGKAVTLISQGFVIKALREGQQVEADNCPFAIPDHLWKALVKHKDIFPYQGSGPGEREKPPWLISSEERAGKSSP